MEIPDLPEEASLAVKDTEEEILERYNWYIVLVAWQIVLRSTRIAHPAVLDLLVDDLIQNSRVKLWLALKVSTIGNLKSYIRQIVHHEFINLVRQHKPVLPLPIDDDGELLAGKLMVTQSEEMDNPERIFEQEEAVASLLDRTTCGVPKLSPKQKRAMICSLKERVDNILQLTEVFKSHGIDVEAFQWPEIKDEVKGLKANLSAARENLRSGEPVIV